MRLVIFNFILMAWYVFCLVVFMQMALWLMDKLI